MAERAKHAGGRPPLIEGQPLERRTVTLPRDLIVWATAEGDGNLSRGLRRLLEELDQRNAVELAEPRYEVPPDEQQD